MSLTNVGLIGWLVLSSALTAILIPGNALAQLPSPRFGEDMFVLEGWDIVLSLDGNNAAGHSRHNSPNDQIEIRLWNLNSRHYEESSSLEPAASVTLAYQVPERMISSLEMRFSPDGKYLAVRKDYDLTILIVPNLEIYAQFNVSNGPGVDPGALSWSPDSRFLATEGSGDLVVWDNQSNELHRRPLEDTWGPIIPVEDGWLVLRYVYDDQPLRNAFSFCSIKGENCTAYRIERLLLPYINGHSVVASPDGLIVLTFGQDDDNQTGVWAWQRNANGNYIRSDSPLVLGEGITPILFSPDGQFMVTYGGKAIWDYQTLTLLQPLDMTSRLVAFGPDNEHFITSSLEDTRMYRVGQEAPIDVFSNLKHLASDAFLDGFIGRQLVASQQWIVVNIRDTGVVIPIQYD